LPVPAHFKIHDLLFFVQTERSQDLMRADSKNPFALLWEWWNYRNFVFTNVKDALRIKL